MLYGGYIGPLTLALGSTAAPVSYRNHVLPDRYHPLETLASCSSLTVAWSSAIAICLPCPIFWVVLGLFHATLALVQMSASQSPAINLNTLSDHSLQPSLIRALFSCCFYHDFLASCNSNNALRAKYYPYVLLSSKFCTLSIHDCVGVLSSTIRPGAVR